MHTGARAGIFVEPRMLYNVLNLSRDHVSRKMEEIDRNNVPHLLGDLESRI